MERRGSQKVSRRGALRSLLGGAVAVLAEIIPAATPSIQMMPKKYRRSDQITFEAEQSFPKASCSGLAQMIWRWNARSFAHAGEPHRVVNLLGQGLGLKESEAWPWMMGSIADLIGKFMALAESDEAGWVSALPCGALQNFPGRPPRVEVVSPRLVSPLKSCLRLRSVGQLNLRRFVFAHGGEDLRGKEAIFQITHHKSVWTPDVPEPLVQYHNWFYVGRPDEFPEMSKVPDPAYTRTFYKPSEGVWDAIHIWMCRVRLYKAGQRAVPGGLVARLGVKLRPWDAKVIHFHQGIHSWDGHLAVQKLEAPWLRKVVDDV